MQFMQTEQSVELNPPIMADHMRPNREENDKCPLPPTGNNFIASVVRTPVSNVGLNVSRDTATCQVSVMTFICKRLLFYYYIDMPWPCYEKLE